MTRLLLALPPLALLAACLAAQPPVAEGAQTYATYCAGCHGANGRGDGPEAAELPARPADLTTLTARNGGTFPATEVMNKIWGGEGSYRDVMPDFAALFVEDPLIPYDGGDGIFTPTPEGLVNLAEHIARLQR
jgi:mono/diheme cytochrome c family protein